MVVGYHHFGKPPEAKKNKSSGVFFGGNPRTLYRNEWSFFNPNASWDCNSYLHLASKFMVNVGRHISYMDPIGMKKNLLLVVDHDQHFLVELLTSLLTLTLRNIY